MFVTSPKKTADPFGGNVVLLASDRPIAESVLLGLEGRRVTYRQPVAETWRRGPKRCATTTRRWTSCGRSNGLAGGPGPGLFQLGGEAQQGRLVERGAGEHRADRQALLGPVQRQGDRRQAGDVAEGAEGDGGDDVEHRLLGGCVLGGEDRAGRGREDRRGGGEEDVEVAAPAGDLAAREPLQRLRGDHVVEGADLGWSRPRCAWRLCGSTWSQSTPS